MPDNAYLESIESLPSTRAEQDAKRESARVVAQAVECARSMVWVPGVARSSHFSERLNRLQQTMQTVFAAVSDPARHGDDSEDGRWLGENADLLRSELDALTESRNALTRTAHVRSSGGELVPRVLVLGQDLLPALNYAFDESSFSAYMCSFQTAVVLQVGELWGVVPALRLLLLERIAGLVLGDSNGAATEAGGIATCIRSLRQISQTSWREVLERLIVFDEILRQDPAGAYARMDADSRAMYRQEVMKLAQHSDLSEVDIASLAISLAGESQSRRERDPRLALRRSHVGYYLFAEGRELLYRRANVRLGLRGRLQAFMRRHPDEFYLMGIEVLTLSMILAVLWWINFSSLWTALFAGLVLLIPCSQSAVEILNYLMTSLLDPQPLPKLDFAEGIPEECTTMVVVPTLLLREKQVRQLVKELEVRYVGNMSANLHFAVLTDLADSAEQPREDDPLVELCGKLIRELNRKYAGQGGGTFSMFHRHRVFNRREGVWMGWERKRGKLLDFNKLIMGEYDSFPYKVADLSILPRVRYVLTLDSDTELPRGAAHRLIGTLAHPLCQAIIDPETNVVTQGYGILQPRVGVSVRSKAQSRLASIYSGRTGFDIYTHAVSDVYQDLYGEGTFVGKGLYEVRTVQRVLDRRFPRNAILSHDLIEGAYTRAALVSDVEVIDRYPSHYSAYVRRKHRWVRGDWQIMEWLFSRVPDESGRRVSNPISLISSWKILDNLRRSMVEPATLVLFLLAWTVLPGRALYWTLVSLAILFFPTVFQFVGGVVRAMLGRRLSAARDAFAPLATGIASVLLSLTFLLHDAMVCTDAIWRSLYRRVVSRRRLLEWETAAEADLARRRRTPLDLYLLCTPVVAIGIGIALFFLRRPAFWVACPILVLWACSKLISVWLDRPPRKARKRVSRNEQLLLRKTALRTWRYFAEFSTQEHNWLIPDNVQEDPPQVAARVSPTNIGLLLNARQTACELGYLTVPEFADLIRQTLETLNRLRLYQGHLLNWYDTRTLSPLPPLFVSTVDSGNFAAALITLSRGCKAFLQKPLISPALLEGYDDYLRALAALKALPSRRVRRSIHRRKDLPFLRRVAAVITDPLLDQPGSEQAEADWFAAEVGARREWVQRILSDYMPWLLPEFQNLVCKIGVRSAETGADIPLAQLPAFTQELETKLRSAIAGNGLEQDQHKCEWLLALLARAHARSTRLINELNQASREAERWLVRMDFSFLLEPHRKLLSIGYYADTGELHSACYDLLASEARVATFVAIAKGDIPQDVWFRLGRTHVPAGGGPALASWAGTMFEYLMPVLWMHSYRDTLLRQSLERAVRAQQAYAAVKRIPWGISESAYCELDDAGGYCYRAFGVPDLALQTGASQRLVVAPYATALALTLDPAASLQNLRRMVNAGWFAKYGFYEAADFAAGQLGGRGPRLVKAWMTHHQGMILLSVTNFLRNDVVRHRFHDDVRVQATELLLQERTVLHHIRKAWHTRPPAVSLRNLRLWANRSSQPETLPAKP